jgi:hypothetical protein
MRPRVCLFASAVFIILINAAPLPAATAASVDACSLLTQEEVSAVVGVPMHSGEHTPPDVMQSCHWVPSKAPPPMGLHLQLWVMPFVEGIFEAEKRRAGQENVTSVSGLGDNAYYAIFGGGSMTVLNVKKGSFIVQVTWIGTTDHQTVMDAERTIATQVLLEL